MLRINGLYQLPLIKAENNKITLTDMKFANGLVVNEANVLH